MHLQPATLDRAALAAFLDPAAPRPPDIAPFLNRPDIQQTLESHLALTQLRLRLKLAAATERAIDNLDRLAAEAANPADSRLASTSLLTLAARLNPTPRDAGRARAEPQTPPPPPQRPPTPCTPTARPPAVPAPPPYPFDASLDLPPLRRPVSRGRSPSTIHDSAGLLPGTG